MGSSTSSRARAANLRIELFGDEIEQIRAFSPFTQRASSCRRGGDPSRASGSTIRRSSRSPPSHRMIAFRCWRRRRTSSGRSRREAALGGRGAWSLSASTARPGSRRSHARSRTFSRRSAGHRRSRARRSRERAREHASAGAPRGRRSSTAEKLSAPSSCSARSTPPWTRTSRRSLRTPRSVLRSARARRGFCRRDLGLALLPDAQVFRKRPPRADARLGRALQSFADLRTGDYVVHEDHGVGRLLGFETKEVAESRATTCTSRSRTRIDSTSRTSSFPRSPATSGRMRGRRPSRSSVGRHGTA